MRNFFTCTIQKKKKILWISHLTISDTWITIVQEKQLSKFGGDFFYLNKFPKQMLGSCHFDLEAKDGVKDKDICHRKQGTQINLHTSPSRENTEGTGKCQNTTVHHSFHHSWHISFLRSHPRHTRLQKTQKKENTFQNKARARCYIR